MDRWSARPREGAYNHGPPIGVIDRLDDADVHADGGEKTVNVASEEPTPLILRMPTPEGSFAKLLDWGLVKNLVHW